MARFSIFPNHEKVGPGVKKNAPKKNKVAVFFETFFANFWKHIPINLVYFLISLPVITNGLANVGITHIVRSNVTEKHSFGLSDFFDTIKKNWKQALIVGILNIIITFLIIVGFLFFIDLKGTFATIAFGMIIFVSLVFIIINFYIWTMMITFDFKLGTLYNNCFKFVFINIWKNLLCLLSVLSIYLAYAIGFYIITFLSTRFYSMFLILGSILFFITYPAFRALMIEYYVFPALVKYIIEPYYKNNPYDDIEKRRDLGLEVPKQKVYDEYGNEIEEDDEIFFED